jgi:hypothetical protein
MQKWEVNGERCCGLFANQSIARGDEITFKYSQLFDKRTVRKYHWTGNLTRD